MPKHCSNARFHFLVALLCAVLLPWRVEAQNDLSGAERVDALRPHFIPVRSIAPQDEDFSDLLPLVERIGRARVVVLGEATHSEGTTSAAKARMVRFLHQVMGFDVVAWESGLVQTEAMNEALRDTSVPLYDAKRYLMSGGWADEEAVDAVFSFARDSWQRRSRPLVMTGFDMGRPRQAAPAFLRFFDDLFARAPRLAFTAEEREQAALLLARGYGFLTRDVPGDSVRMAQRAVLKRLGERLRIERSALASVISPREQALAERFVEDALMGEHLKALGPPEKNYQRDRAMANTLQWLLDVRYPDRKIIVWAATAHFIRNSTLIEHIDHPDWYAVPWEAGNHLYPVLGTDLYTIAFTAYDGTAGDIYPSGARMETEVAALSPAPAGSFEALAHALGHRYGFVDLRGAPHGTWMRQAFVSVALGRLPNRAPWSEVVDAFFFIDHAEPIRYLPAPRR